MNAADLEQAEAVLLDERMKVNAGESQPPIAELPATQPVRHATQPVGTESALREYTGLPAHLAVRICGEFPTQALALAHYCHGHSLGSL